MNKYLNFLLTFVTSKLASLIFLYVLYNYHEEQSWKMYSLYLVNISLMRNITFSFTSNLGHEGLLSENITDYKKLFSVVLFVVFSLQSIGFIVGSFIVDNNVFVYAYLFTLIGSLQGIIQNYYRFSGEYLNYSKSSLLFSLGNLGVVVIFFFSSLEVYLSALVLISTMLLLRYLRVLREIVIAFDYNYLKTNIVRLFVSSLKLYFINTLPDSIFVVYVPLFFIDFFTDQEYAALVFLIAHFGVKSYPILGLIIQEKMDSVKKNHFDTNYLQTMLERFIKNESRIILLLVTGFVLFELFYMAYFAEPLLILLPIIGSVFWILPLVFLRHFVNSIIEVKKDLSYKLLPSLFSILILIYLYFSDVSILIISLAYWINLIALTAQHIYYKYLRLQGVLKFYIPYILIGLFLYLNYYIHLDVYSEFFTTSYLMVNVAFLCGLIIYYRRLLFKTALARLINFQKA